MTLQILRGSAEAPLDPLLTKIVAVIGFGNQGHAHALNLRASKISVIVGSRSDSPSATQARLQGFRTEPIATAVSRADLIILALPDEVQPEVYHREIEPQVRAGSVVGFLHGFNIRFGFIKPKVDIGVIMVAPKGPGSTLRERFEMGQGIPCLMAVHQESPSRHARSIGLAWANAIGCARAGIIMTSFDDETDTDLFGEQSVLCGGMTELIVAAFDTLVKAGYPPELAYLECCHEVKQIADLVYARGLAGMMDAISNTAEFGAYAAGPRVIDDHVRQKLSDVLSDIRSGEFARRMRDDYKRGFPWFTARRAALAMHPGEAAGQTIRSLMPWLTDSEKRG